MGDISEHFSRHEFECGCGTKRRISKCGCGFCIVEIEIISILEYMRYDLGENVVNIHSGCRCPYYNGIVQGTKGSMHTKIGTVDFDIETITTREVYDYLDSRYPDKYGIGYYPNWVHLDIRSSKARW